MAEPGIRQVHIPEVGLCQCMCHFKQAMDACLEVALLQQRHKILRVLRNACALCATLQMCASQYALLHCILGMSCCRTKLSSHLHINVT